MFQGIFNDIQTSEKGGCAMSTAGTRSLLAFPGEIRNRIYKILFGQPIVLVNDDISNLPRARVPGINLLATCRQTHSEAVGVLYARNDFTILLT